MKFLSLKSSQEFEKHYKSTLLNTNCDDFKLNELFLVPLKQPINYVYRLQFKLNYKPYEGIFGSFISF